MEATSNNFDRAANTRKWARAHFAPAMGKRPTYKAAKGMIGALVTHIDPYDRESTSVRVSGLAWHHEGGQVEVRVVHLTESGAPVWSSAQRGPFETTVDARDLYHVRGAK